MIKATFINKLTDISLSDFKYKLKLTLPQNEQ